VLLSHNSGRSGQNKENGVPFRLLARLVRQGQRWSLPRRQQEIAVTQTLKKYVLALTASLALLAGAASAAAPTPVEAEIIRLTNLERQKAGLPPLRENHTITGVAQAYAALMARMDKLGHNLDGHDAGWRLNQAGYRWTAWGENIAYGYPDAASVVQGWMASPEHRANILNPNFTEIGVGVAKSRSGTPSYDQVFARPAR
jgi:uncharacterized protein YkwD